MDTAGVIGMHGLDMDTIYRVGEAFRSHGFYPRIKPNVRHVSVALIKDGIRTDWTCHRIVNGRAYEFPGVELPLHLFEQLGEIEFIGERFRTPNPPEEYLRRKYGPDWRTPKGTRVRVRRRRRGRGRRTAGPRDPGSCASSPWVCCLAPTSVCRSSAADGDSVAGAELAVAGLGRSRTDARGIARFYVPGFACYAMTVTYPGHRELLYEEFLTPDALITPTTRAPSSRRRSITKRASAPWPCVRRGRAKGGCLRRQEPRSHVAGRSRNLAARSLPCGGAQRTCLFPLLEGHRAGLVISEAQAEPRNSPSW